MTDARKGTILAEAATNVGGILGCAKAGFTIAGKDSTNKLHIKGAITGKTYVGGVVGDVWISNAECIAKNITLTSLTVTANTSFAGGIFGEVWAAQTDGILIEEISAETSFVVSAQTYAGGLIGYAYNSLGITIKNATVKTTINKYEDILSYAGGLRL